MRFDVLLVTLAIAAMFAGAPHLAAQPAAQTPLTAQESTPNADFVPEPPPEVGKPAMRPATDFVMPDLPDRTNERTAYDGPHFSTRLSLVPLVDFTLFSQDDESISQVGEQKSEWDLRTFRIMFRGEVKSAHPVQYFISVEVKGKDHVDPDKGDSKVGFTDWYFATQVGRLGEIRFGKIKEPFVYEVIGDAANLQQQERMLAPFAVGTRNIGVRLSNTMAGERMTWAAGWFNDWWLNDEAFDESGNQFSARLTGVPHWANDGADYVHLGISPRYLGPEEGQLRFRARPESNIASYYVDSGSIPADHATEINFEAAVGRGPLFVTADYARIWVDSPEIGNPHFSGGWVVVSYVLTGEHRPYDRKLAYARRILPRGRWGAWEIFARYARVDVDDRTVEGGILDQYTMGLSWWATRRWRISTDYGITNLDRFGLNGITQQVHTRFQWVY